MSDQVQHADAGYHTYCSLCWLNRSEDFLMLYDMTTRSVMQAHREQGPVQGDM